MIRIDANKLQQLRITSLDLGELLKNVCGQRAFIPITRRIMATPVMIAGHREGSNCAISLSRLSFLDSVNVLLRNICTLGSFRTSGMIRI